MKKKKTIFKTAEKKETKVSQRHSKIVRICRKNFNNTILSILAFIVNHLFVSRGIEISLSLSLSLYLSIYLSISVYLKYTNT